MNLVYTSCIHARSTPMSPRPAGAAAKGLAPAAPAALAGAPAPNGEDATAAEGVPNGDAAGAGAGAPNGEAAGAGAGAPKPNGAGAGAGCCPKGEGAAGDCSAIGGVLPGGCRRRKSGGARGHRSLKCLRGCPGDTSEWIYRNHPTFRQKLVDKRLLREANGKVQAIPP